MDAIYGVTRATFVYHQSMYMLLRDTLGASGEQPDKMWPEMRHLDGEFHRYLDNQGVDGNAFVNATGEWMARFQADSSGKAMAEYNNEVFQLRGRQPRPTAAEYEQASRNPQAAGNAGGVDAIYGVTKEALAEVLTKYGELKAQFGEKQAEGAFKTYLASRGMNSDQWAHAHNGWHERFRTDPTGRAQAEFHMLLQQMSQKAHFADVRDMSADTLEGISLDQYAQIVVAVSRQGADANAIVTKFGLRDVAHWQRANDAWTAKMGQDTTHKLTMQYGQLYQKYAGPQFQEEMVQQTAAILADANKPRDVVDEPEVELTPELCLSKLQSQSRNERWKYAGLYANMADLGNVPDKAAAIRTLIPHLMEMLERHDDNTTSDAEKAVRKLWDLEVRNAEIPGAIQRCMARAKERLQAQQAAFAPIQNQAVPERVFLQSSIQDFTSLVATMQEYAANDWSASSATEEASAGPSFAQAPGYAAPAGGGFAMPTRPASSGGFPKWIIAPVVVVIVLGGIGVRALLSRSSAPSASASSTATAATTSAPTTKATAPVAASVAAPKPPQPAAKPQPASSVKAKHK
jgi:hypothetical protein